MLKSILLVSVLILFFSCETQTETKIQKVNEDKIESVTIDTLSVLNRYNSDDNLYIGTDLYNKIIDSNVLIEYDRVVRDEFIHTKFDSVFFNLKNDTLYLHHVFFALGRMGNEEFAYLEHKGKVATLKTPFLNKGSIRIKGNDTIVNGSVGCDCTGQIEQIFKVPISELENMEHLLFRNEKINFR